MDQVLLVFHVALDFTFVRSLIPNKAAVPNQLHPVKQWATPESMRCQLLTPSTKSNVITLSTEEAGLKFSIEAMVSQTLHHQAGINMHIQELASWAKISSLLLIFKIY